MNVSFVCETKSCSTFDGYIEPVTLTKDNYKVTVNYTPMLPGHDVIDFKIFDDDSGFE